MLWCIMMGMKGTQQRGPQRRPGASVWIVSRKVCIVLVCLVYEDAWAWDEWRVIVIGNFCLNVDQPVVIIIIVTANLALGGIAATMLFWRKSFT